MAPLSLVPLPSAFGLTPVSRLSKAGGEAEPREAKPSRLTQTAPFITEPEQSQRRSPLPTFQLQPREMSKLRLPNWLSVKRFHSISSLNSLIPHGLKGK